MCRKTLSSMCSYVLSGEEDTKDLQTFIYRKTFQLITLNLFVFSSFLLQCLALTKS